MSHSEALRPSPWALSELLALRRVLGVGALLTWIVFFHMLVNVWLLCVFTSLLVVLGGWLGSQAALDSNSVVHLERFVSMEKIPKSPECEALLDGEIRDTVRKVIRDFVSSWYRTVSSEPDFETEVEAAMLSMAMELKRRSGKVDQKALTQRALNLCGCHLQSYIRVREMIREMGKQPGGEGQGADSSLWELYCKVSRPHPALKSSGVEVNYARAIVDLLLHVLVPPPHLETRTGRFVVCELITCNVLLPLISKLSDPDWLNLLIVDVFTKSSKRASDEMEPVKAPSASVTMTTQQKPRLDLEVPCSLTLRVQPDSPTVTEASTPELAAYEVVDSVELYSQQVAEEEEEEEEEEEASKMFSAGKAVGSPLDYLRPGKFNPFYQETDSDLESPLSDFKKDSMESLVLIGQEEALSDRLCECATPTDPEEELPSFTGLVESSCPKAPASPRLDHPEALSDLLEEKEARRNECRDPEKRGGEKESLSEALAEKCQANRLTATTPLQMSSPATGVVSLATFSFEPLSSPEGPVVIQNLRITGTITAKEHRGTGSHPYTLYTVKYETAVDTENPGLLQPVAYHMVNRRYSEFLNLQTRLEEKPELRKILKNVKGPKKIFPDLPFGNMDSDRVEARKSLLETFLKQLCAIPETANSVEMQEFLALNTDARIAFVKKPFTVSRIDKIVVNAIVDTLKTAFPRSEPQSPTEDLECDSDGKSQSDVKKTKSRLRFSSKIAPVLDIAGIQPKVIYCFGEEITVFNGLSLNGLEAFLKEREAALGGKGISDGFGSSEREPVTGTPSQGAATDMALADVALNILCLLMKDQWSWLCTENVQKTIRLLFGTLIHRWLDVSVTNLTCTQYWVIYLRVLQEAIWPGGILPAQPRPERSQQQKEETRRLSLNCLMSLLPDMVSDILGPEKYKLSWQTVLESLQDPHINRHLVYCVWDLLLEFLIPEASCEEFQKSLLNSLSGTADRLSV